MNSEHEWYSWLNVNQMKLTIDFLKTLKSNINILYMKKSVSNCWKSDLTYGGYETCHVTLMANVLYADNFCQIEVCERLGRNQRSRAREKSLVCWQPATSFLAMMPSGGCLPACRRAHRTGGRSGEETFDQRCRRILSTMAVAIVWNYVCHLPFLPVDTVVCGLLAISSQDAITKVYFI